MMDHAIIKSLVTMNEMINDRKYSDKACCLNETLVGNEFVQRATSNNGVTITIDDKVLIIYLVSHDYDLATIKKLIQPHGGDVDVIIVTSEKLLSYQLTDLESYNKNISAFQLKELQFNITKHCL